MSLGQKLRQERERRGVSLADIAKETRISSRHLEAIESGDTKTMPRDFFYKSFTRQYATYLGLEPKEVDTAIELEMGAPAVAMAAAASASSRGIPSIVAPPKAASPSAAASVKAAPVVAPTPAPQQSLPSPGMFLQESRTSLPWLALAGLLLAGSVTYLAWDRVGGAAKPATAVAEAPKAPEAAKEVAASAPTVTTMDNGTTVEATKLSSGSIKLVISAKEAAWIQLDADGKPLWVGLLEAGQTREVDAAQQAKLLTGNAGGIQVMQNGKPIPELGSRGEVRTVVFDKENYQVIRPTPKVETPAEKVDAPKPDSRPVAD
jgi:cytoskeleton protein RodZ